MNMNALLINLSVDQIDDHNLVIITQRIAEESIQFLLRLRQGDKQCHQGSILLTGAMCII